MTAVVVVPFDLAFIDLATAHMYHPIQILINLIDVIFLVDIVLKRVSAGSEDALPRELEGGGGAKDRRTGVESVRTRPSGTGRFNTAIFDKKRDEWCLDRGKIARRYLRGSVILDVVAIVPWRLIAKYASSTRVRPSRRVDRSSRALFPFSVSTDARPRPPSRPPGISGRRRSDASITSASSSCSGSIEFWRWSGTGARPWGRSSTRTD